MPVRVGALMKLPAPAGLSGWFTAAGLPLQVAAVETGPAKVILVSVPAGAELFNKLIPASRRSEPSSDMRSSMQLGPDDRVLILALGSSAYRGSKVPADLFQISRELTAKDGGMLGFLTSSRVITLPQKEKTRIADAVAVAGLQATSE